MKKFIVIAITLLFLTGCGLLGFGGGHIDAVPSQEGDHPIVGVWEWTASRTYIYIFNADGNGSRGTAPAVQNFTWAIDEAGHLSMSMGRTTEHWYMEISDDVLTINSRQIANMRYSYNRRAGS